MVLAFRFSASTGANPIPSSWTFQLMYTSVAFVLELSHLFR